LSTGNNKGARKLQTAMRQAKLQNLYPTSEEWKGEYFCEYEKEKSININEHKEELQRNGF
jgi:hypothetical protein